MPFGDMMRDRIALLKKDGTLVKENIKAQVSPGRIITFEADLPLEPGDHFLRKLPSGLVEDFEVLDPNFMSGIGGIPDSYQSKVRRTDQPPATQQNVVQSITAHFHGANSRLTVGTDNSVNTINDIQPSAVAGFLEQLKPHLHSFPEVQRAQLEPSISALENEIKAHHPDQSKVRSALQSIKAVAEGAAGNLVASGVVAMLGRLLAG